MKKKPILPEQVLDDDDLVLGPTGSDGDITDPDIARVFKEEQIGHGEQSGRDHTWKQIRAHVGLDPELRAGDLDADLEDVNFVGEEAPGGGHPTPDQSDVDDIGRAVGVHYQDNEPLDMEQKVAHRDDERWELDPASSEDFPERMRERTEPLPPQPRPREAREFLAGEAEGAVTGRASRQQAQPRQPAPEPRSEPRSEPARESSTERTLQKEPATRERTPGERGGSERKHW